jgi:Uma2 family endonuclease
MRSMKAADSRVTYAELQQWPDDGRQYELYDGEVIVVPSPFPRHQRVASNIECILRDYESAAGGLTFHAPLDIVLSEHNVVQPDLLYFREERRGLVKDWEATRAAPDLAVEVLSRGTEARDRGRRWSCSRASASSSTGSSIRPGTRSRSTCVATRRTSGPWQPTIARR